MLTNYQELVNAALAGDGPLARAVRGAVTEPCVGRLGMEEVMPVLAAHTGCDWCSGTGRVPRDVSGWPTGALAGALLYAAWKAAQEAPMATYDEAIGLFYRIRDTFHFDDPDGEARERVAAALEMERNGG